MHGLELALYRTHLFQLLIIIVCCVLPKVWLWSSSTSTLARSAVYFS